MNEYEKGDELKKLNFFTKIKTSYIAIIILSIVLLTTVSYSRFKTIYIEVINSSNEQILTYVTTMYDQKINIPINLTYTDYMLNQNKAYNVDKFLSEAVPNPYDAYIIYENLSQSLMLLEGSMINAIHFYSNVSKSMVSTQYGFKSGEDVERLIGNLVDVYSKQTGNTAFNAWTSPYRTSTGGSSTFYISYMYGISEKVGLPGKDGGFIAFEIDVNKFSKYINTDKDREIFILDPSGVILFHSDNSMIGTKYESDIAFTDDRNFKLDFTEEIVTSYIKSGVTGLIFVAKSSAGDFYPVLRDMLTSAAVIAVAFILISLIVSSIISYYISRPIKAAIKELDEVSGNNKSTPMKNDIPEIMGRIRDEFSSMNSFIASNKEMMKNNLVISMYFEKAIDNSDLDRRLTYIGFSKTEDYYFSIVIKFKYDMNHTSMEAQNMLNYKMVTDIERVSPPVKMLAAQVDQNIIAIVCNAGSIDKAISIIEEITANVLCDIFIGDPGKDLAVCAEEFSKLKRLFSYVFLNPRKKVFVFNEYRNRIESPKSYDIQLDRFEESLRNTDMEQAFSELKGIIKQLEEMPISYENAQMVLVNVISKLTAVAKNANVKLQTLPQILEIAEIEQFEATISDIIHEY